MTLTDSSNFSIFIKNMVLLFVDIFFGFVSLSLAFLLKYDWTVPTSQLNFYFHIIPLVLAFRSFSFLFFRFNSQYRQDPWLENIGQIIKSILMGSLLILLYVFGSSGTLEKFKLSMTILIIDGVILLGLQVGFQFFWNGLKKNLKRPQSILNENSSSPMDLKKTPFMGEDESIQIFGIGKLLGRDPVYLDMKAIRNVIQGRVVMVTGAGGSIGSELCEQVLEFKPAALVMIDRGENYLHELKVTLEQNDTTVQNKFIYGSITNKEKMENVFERYRPNIVFHAAANKHVPIMEDNIDEAISNNVYGTKVVADLSDKYNVDSFVLISTDKVVKPTSIMGMTKRIAEQYVRFLSETSKTHFLTVRFGNVLGSKGSVVPMFKKQVTRGGPVTITHPEMERFLMLIPEAVGLILQTTAFSGSGGRVFVLDMGCPVKIVDLAKKMIQIFKPKGQKDIEIKYIGVRPGEKLSEELILDEEKIIPTIHKKIKMLKSNVPYNPHYDEWLDSLCRHASDPNPDPDKIRSIMSEMIPDTPSSISTIIN